MLDYIVLNQIKYIRIQSNGFPNHCYFQNSTNINEQNFDFEVKFNWDTGTLYK